MAPVRESHVQARTESYFSIEKLIIIRAYLVPDCAYYSRRYPMEIIFGQWPLFLFFGGVGRVKKISDDPMITLFSFAHPKCEKQKALGEVWKPPAPPHPRKYAAKRENF